MQCSNYYINTNEIPGELYYVVKGAIYYVTISSGDLFICEDIMFLQLTWYFIGVYMCI